MPSNVPGAICGVASTTPGVFPPPPPPPPPCATAAPRERAGDEHYREQRCDCLPHHHVEAPPSWIRRVIAAAASDLPSDVGPTTTDAGDQDRPANEARWEDIEAVFGTRGYPITTKSALLSELHVGTEGAFA